MKLKKLHFISTALAGAILYLMLSSYSTGITGQSVAGCTCHAPTASAATVISLTGLPANYVAGTTYNLTLTVTNMAKVAAGFDMTVNLGTFTATAAGTVTASAGQELRHTTPKTLTSGSASWTLDWTAPATGAAAVTFNIAGNAVNLNSTNDANDIWNTSTITVSPVTVNVPIVIVGTPSGITSNAATINGQVNAGNGNTAVTVEYGLTTAYGSTATATPNPVTGSTLTAVTAALSTLAPATTYHYRIRAVNTAGATNSPDNTFTTLAATSAPTITVGAPTGITTTAATINGTVNANNANATVTVEYGLTTSYGSTTNATPNTVTGTTATAVTAALATLLPATTYHYRIKAVNSIGTTNSPDNTFTTQAPPSAPTIVVGAPSGIGSTGATVNGTVNANNANATVTVEYGLTTSYGSTINAAPNTVTGATATAVTGALSALLPLTTYHYRIKAVNSVGTTNSPDNTFTTLAPPVLPIVIVGSPSGITSAGATVNGQVNAGNDNTNVTVEYGTTTAYGSSINATPNTVTGSTLTAVSGAISGLASGTTYHYRIVASNSAGTTNSADSTFTTQTITLLPVITLGAPTSITNTGATVNAIVNANGPNASVVIEYGTTLLYGTIINASPNVVAGSTPVAVFGTMTNLQPRTTYHYRVKATSSAGSTFSPDAVLKTDNLGIASIEEDGFSLYPNPAADQLVLTTRDNAAVTIYCTELSGKQIALPYRKIANDQYSIQIAHLPAGMYFLVMKTGTEVKTTRFTKM